MFVPYGKPAENIVKNPCEKWDGGYYCGFCSGSELKQSSCRIIANTKHNEALYSAMKREADQHRKQEPAPWEIGPEQYAADHLEHAEQKSALDTQVGGNHYKTFAIQPIEFTTKNKLGFIPGCVIKRICRYNRPGGKGLEDLQKIKHEIDCLIDMEFGGEKKNG